MSDEFISKILYSEHFPSYFFINSYPVLAMFWNIFLLLVPFFILVFLKKNLARRDAQKTVQKMIGFFLFFLWLIFIPNSAYIITDVRHLMDYCPITSSYRVCTDGAWMIMVFFLYSVLGWIGFVYLVRGMNGIVEKIYNKTIANIFILILMPLVSLGVLLGLINRWNSWEIFYRIDYILHDISLYFTDISYAKNLIVYSVSFYILFITGDLIFTKNELFKNRKS